jgi:magnesium chelatase family protein
LVGGGSVPRPGEISLAHHGVLFLDELLEYDRRALEGLREPLESGVVSISRATHHVQYPAQFQLIAAMNPCPCGRFGDPQGNCDCSPGQIAQYMSRVSGPMLERFDIHLEVPRVNLNDFDDVALHSESSASVAARVKAAREIQIERQGRCNARLSDGQITRLCAPETEAKTIINMAMEQLGFSARTRQRILKLARTIADLSGAETICATHVSEAVTYRMLDRRPTKPKDSKESSEPTPWVRP